MLKFSPLACTLLVLLLATEAIAQDQTELLKRGAQAYRICAACHSLQPDVHLSGPSLADRWGKEAGTIEDFGRYTEGLKKSGIIWEENSLEGWIAEPQAMVPGTTMTFRGVQDEQTRKNLIAFLREALSLDGNARMVKSGLIPDSIASGPIPEDVSSLGDNQRIKEIRHCRDGYYVTTADGAQFPFWETNVRIKIDTSARGPGKGEPVLLRSGMAGDRVSVVFASLADLNRLLAEKC
jgi:cytochrome c